MIKLTKNGKRIPAPLWFRVLIYINFALILIPLAAIVLVIVGLIGAAFLCLLPVFLGVFMISRLKNP